MEHWYGPLPPNEEILERGSKQWESGEIVEDGASWVLGLCVSLGLCCDQLLHFLYFWKVLNHIGGKAVNLN